MLHLSRGLLSFRTRRQRDLPPIELSRDEAAEARFCFLGEFGYEMISWLPYLRFLKNKLQIPIRTAGRPGSSVYYSFSDDHVELDEFLLGDVWGDSAVYAGLHETFDKDILVYPGRQPINERRIVVGGYDWRTRNIHTTIDQTHYARLDYSHVPAWSPLSGNKLVVINNKYYRQWPGEYDKPVNYFAPADLEQLRDTLRKRGYGVVYNHFVERTEDRALAFDDSAIFRGQDSCFDLRDEYESCCNAADRNRLQLSVYNSAAFVIGPQGGNLYVPAICRRPLYILMRAGDYVDYVELGRIYGVGVEAFYEPRHLLHWIDTTL